MNDLSSIAVLIAGIIGVITGIVSWRVLRQEFKMDSPVLGICIGALAGIGLATHMGGAMSALLIPYEALGIALVAMFLLMAYFKDKKGGESKKPLPRQSDRRSGSKPEDPWEKEIRTGGRLAKKYGKRLK